MPASALIGLLMLLLATPAFAQSGETRDSAATLEMMRQEKRVALVIGNSAYPADARLRNPVNDAEAITRALEGMGFTVMLRRDVGPKEIRHAIAEFGDRIKGGGVALFFFAGHGLQHSGNNYLIPVDVPIPTERDMASLTLAQMTDISLVVDRMEKAKNRVNIVILDASRDNPFGRLFRSRAGLASMDATSGALIAYATEPGRAARDDGAGDNSIYTGALLKVLQEPGLKIEDAFNRVRQRVQAQTGGQQVPWKSSSLTGDFYFVLPRVAALPKPEPEPVRIPVDVGSLSILGKQDGIEVWLGDQRIGEAQAGLALVVNKLLPGTYRVRAHKSGYKEWGRQVQVVAKQQTDVLIDLEKAISERPKALGSLGIVGRVPGVEVWLGSEKVGETRSGSELVVDNLEPGNYVLQARRPGYRDWQRQVQVGPNQRVQVVIDIEPIPEPPAPRAEPQPTPERPVKPRPGERPVFVPPTF